MQAIKTLKATARKLKRETVKAIRERFAPYYAFDSYGSSFYCWTEEEAFSKLRLMAPDARIVNKEGRCIAKRSHARAYDYKFNGQGKILKFGQPY